MSSDAEAYDSFTMGVGKVIIISVYSCLASGSEVSLD